MLSAVSRSPDTSAGTRIAWDAPAAQATPTSDPIRVTVLDNSARGRAISFQTSDQAGIRENPFDAEPSVNSESLVGDPETPTCLRERTCRLCTRGTLALLGGSIAGAAAGLIGAISQHQAGARDETAWNTALQAGIPVGLVASGLIYRALRNL